MREGTKRGGLIRLTVGTLMGLGGLGWAVRGLDAGAVTEAMGTASPGWISLALVGVVGVALAKTARWAALYPTAEHPVSFWQLFTILMGAQMVNVLIPIRLGELMRIGLMKQAGQPGAVTISTLVVEKTLDLAAAALVAVALVTLTVTPAWLQAQAGGVLLLSTILTTGLVLLVVARGRINRFFSQKSQARRVLPRWLRSALGTGLAALGVLSHGGVLSRIILWTVCIWLLSLLTMLALLVAFGLQQLPLTAAVVMMLAVSSSNIAPSPPALVGVMHLIAVVVLSQYGVARPVAVGFGTVLNAVTVLPLVILGSGALWLQLIPLQAWLRQRSPDNVGVE